MTGLNWTYEHLCTVISSCTRNSSSPTSAADLNPAIRQLLQQCPGSYIFALGGHSIVLSITECIVAKVSLKAGDRHTIHEQSIFALLDQMPCEHMVQCYFYGPDITFMQHLRGGTLYDRMAKSNIPRPIHQWMRQLSDAVAWLESHGYAHGDINPRNILFDDEDQLKLTNFDHTLKIGDNLNVGEEPYVRCRKRGKAGGQNGTAGPVTEQLAMGSIFWYMTRGTELFHELDRPEKVECLMERRFPAMDSEDPIDSIINDCFLGKFKLIADLSSRIKNIEKFDEIYQARKKECERYYQLLAVGKI